MLEKTTSKQENILHSNRVSKTYIKTLLQADQYSKSTHYALLVLANYQFFSAVG